MYSTGPVPGRTHTAPLSDARVHGTPVRPAVAFPAEEWLIVTKKAGFINEKIRTASCARHTSFRNRASRAAGWSLFGYGFTGAGVPASRMLLRGRRGVPRQAVWRGGCAPGGAPGCAPGPGSGCCSRVCPGHCGSCGFIFLDTNRRGN